MEYRNNSKRELKFKLLASMDCSEEPCVVSNTLQPQTSFISDFPTDMIVIEEVDKPEGLQ